MAEKRRFYIWEGTPGPGIPLALVESPLGVHVCVIDEATGKPIPNGAICGLHHVKGTDKACLYIYTDLNPRLHGFFTVDADGAIVVITD
jgi:hypothetical protein